jgi:phage terminase large subunit-like protein
MDEGVNMVSYGQGFASMAAPSREIEKIILENGFTHEDNSVFNWMAGNVVVREDPAGNKKPDKAKSTEKIDGIVASLMCLGRFLENEDEDQDSYTATNGIVVV